METKIKTLLSVFLVISVLSYCTSCSIRFNDRIKPSKNYITRNYNVKEFSKIDIKSIGDVYYTQSTNDSISVQIYGPDNIIDLIQVSIKNGTLRLEMKEELHNNIKNLKINICSPQLSRIDFQGVGDIHADSPFKTDKLEIEDKGVGNINIKQLECKSLKVYAKGVGDINLEGIAEDACFDSKGVGNINAQNLQADTVKAYAKGVGDISCYAVKSLDASNSGIGDIKYKGNPANKNINKRGIGSIKNN